jgi:hypothetical protein
MTTRASGPKTHTNGAATTTPAVAAPTLDDRVSALEQSLTKIAAVVASLMAQQLQPQVQAGILAQLTGQQPPTRTET